jgi:hypothetical protein
VIKKIISGGQTGTDQAALDAAIKAGIPHGGWISKGRLTESGKLPEKFLLQEMPTESNSARTEQNVIDSDGTLIISHGPLSGGSEYTREMALKHNRPNIHIDLNEASEPNAVKSVLRWIKKYKIEILNVAGPRASQDPHIYQAALQLIEKVLSPWGYPHRQNTRRS